MGSTEYLQVNVRKQPLRIAHHVYCTVCENGLTMEARIQTIETAGGSGAKQNMVDFTYSIVAGLDDPLGQPEDCERMRMLCNLHNYRSPVRLGIILNCT
jgi:hypothetical protein